jgi:hypothetical protein
MQVEEVVDDIAGVVVRTGREAYRPSGPDERCEVK